MFKANVHKKPQCNPSLTSYIKDRSTAYAFFCACVNHMCILYSCIAYETRSMPAMKPVRFSEPNETITHFTFVYRLTKQANKRTKKTNKLTNDDC